MGNTPTTATTAPDAGAGAKRRNPLTRGIEKAGKAVFFFLFIAAAFGLGGAIATVNTKRVFWKDAQKAGYAWHSREDGRWVWKTTDEVQECSITPMVDAANQDILENMPRLGDARP